MREQPLFITLCGLLAPLSVAAATPTTPACHQEIEPLKRLECYDQAFPPTRAVLEAAAEKTVQQFGLDAQSVKPRAPVGGSAPEQITSRILRLQESSDGQRTITLENAQVWLLDDNRGVLSEGDLITIRKGVLGGHLAMTKAGVQIRTSRLR